jgi:hypothetical protein
MPLRDHFRPPLSTRRHWHGFHSAWATYLSSDLNRLLPPGYFAEPNVQFGIEIDVAAFEESRDGASQMPSSPGSLWSPPAPAQTIPLALLTDIIEVAVYSAEGGPTLAGAIELVSPTNKDRAAHRDAFVSKCAAYIQQGIGLVIVDVVTERKANLHQELVARVGEAPAPPFGSELYAVAYRPVTRAGKTTLDLWQETLSIGGLLPTLPLWLRGGLCLPVNLEASYERTCEEQRVPRNGA